MELMTTNLNTNIYIQSEAEFNRACWRGFWEKVGNFITRRQSQLQAFDSVFDASHPNQAVSLGIKDVPVEKITGSMGRSQDFTRCFAPLMSDQRGKERWRMIYTLAATGRGFPPADVYKIGSDYFVKDGHHRISVARYLGWKTIHAHVTEIRLPFDAPPSSNQLDWCGANCPC